MKFFKRQKKDNIELDEVYRLLKGYGSLTLTNSQNRQKSFKYGFFYVKFLFFDVVCVVYL